MKTILFPTDFSEVADNAFIHALEFAKIMNGEIILLHSFDMPIVTDNQFFPENYLDILNNTELGEFEYFKEKIKKLKAIADEQNLGSINLSHRLMSGSLFYNIQDSIKEDKIDFVVMGTSGATGWKEFFVGTNTASILTAIKVPIFSVPIEAKFKKIEVIGFTTRYREKDKKALREVLDIAKKAHAKVKCLYVKISHSDVFDTEIEAWKKEFEHEPIEFFVLPDENVKETILDFISNQEIDVLAMLDYKKNFFVDLFTTSLTTKFSFISKIPILVLHE